MALTAIAIRPGMLGLLAILFFASMRTADGGDPAAQQLDNDRIRVCKEAWMASLGTPVNGRGLCHYVMTKNKVDLIVADAVVEIGGERYRIDAKVHTHYITKSLRSRVIIREPGTVFLADFTAGGVLMGSHVLQERHRALPPELTDWVFSPVQPIVQVNPLKMDWTNTKRTNSAENGDVELFYSKHPIHMKIVCAKEYDYNISSCTSHLNGLDGPVASYETVKWRHISSKWFVQEILRGETMWNAGTKGDEIRQSLKYSEFDPNYLPPEDRFSLESVGLKKGARIQDRRPGAAHSDHYYERSEDGKQDPSLASVVNHMPSDAVMRPWYRKNWLRWTVSFTGAALFLAGMIALYRRRRGRNNRAGTAPRLQASR